MNNIILKYALQNAIRYNGEASVGSVIGKVFSEIKDLDKKKVALETKKIVDEVNKLSLEEQKEKLKKIDPKLLEKKVEKRGLFNSYNIKGKVITAFPPEPSKYMHLGQVKALMLNYELAKIKKGKFIFRFEDTNPILVKKEFYKNYLDNLDWLGIKPNKITYASSNMNKFYKLAEQLIKEEKAYVCKHSLEDIRESRSKGKECEDRNNDVKENLKLWKEMFKGKKYVLRLKIDLKHKNSTMRDPTIFRLIKEKHPKLSKKHIVWPTYDFENSVMDALDKITHRFRTKEFELRNELHRFIQKSLGFKETQMYELARFNLRGVSSSGRVIREKIDNKELIGWDDPSLITIVALRRRGFKPEALKNFVLSTGISKSESELEWNDLIMHNKRLLEKEAKRYFFVEDPIKIKIINSLKSEVKVPFHPDNKKLGFRKFKVDNEFYIKDKIEKNKPYRLMHLFNFKNNEFLSKELDQKLNAKLIHWLPCSKDLVKVEVLMPDKQIISGLAEKDIKKLKVNEVVQFVRFGFVRLDSKEKDKLVFWYSHG
ncbi:MAG: glutamate--tRNA ligase [Candidatus Nanoarchaeia archaeon]|jgi:glutamyl-tRNA synthetase|nr:glutamate--tRNA ligase [Candidatus Nanoarchaeia archaeon]|tara:strand:- start:55629 stop:57251 length:1623 start_codon:yes stop_codon:yes gene_type:complete